MPHCVRFRLLLAVAVGGVSTFTARPAAAQAEPTLTVRTVQTSSLAPAIGPRLAARLRASPDEPVSFIARGLTAAAIVNAGAVPTGQIGPITSGRGNAEAVGALGATAAWLEAPQPLRPALDAARRATGADATDEGRGFPSASRGAGALIAIYDSGVDLTHPDLRQVGGPSRVLGLWDQDGDGPAPAAGFGRECEPTQLLADQCDATDVLGHGTTVLAVAASNGPEFRGVAPDADLVVVRASSFDELVPAMAYAADFAAAVGRPMVFNLALTGHQGPHDGTSLEAQAIDAYAHAVIAAAGNEGALPIHATAALTGGSTTTALLRFDALLRPQPRQATVEVWGPPGVDGFEVALELRRLDGSVAVQTAHIAPGAPGRTDVIDANGQPLITADLDASAGRTPSNDRASVRVGLDVQNWEDPPVGFGWIAIRVSGNGTFHLWVDSPATEPSPIRFETEARFAGQTLGDNEITVSEPATASAAVSVGAFTTRAQFSLSDGSPLTFDDEVDELAAFTSRGPSLNPDATGPKPDMTAPGQYIIAARSRDVSAEEEVTLSSLYRIAAGTSFASALTAGAAAVLLGERPELTPEQIKRALVDNASAPPRTDERWGAGRLDVSAALAATSGGDDGCSCRSTHPSAAGVYFAWLLCGLLVVMRKGRVILRRGARLGRHQA